MFTKLCMEKFKNFRSVELALGPLTLLLGTNASGKSNIRDAFRFLHGIARGYTLAEVFGDKYLGGSREWLGIRGGTKEVTYRNEPTFALSAEFNSEKCSYKYHIEVMPGGGESRPPRVVKESLFKAGKRVFDSHPDEDHLRPQPEGPNIRVRLARDGNNRKIGKPLSYTAAQAVLPQIAAGVGTKKSDVVAAAKDCVDTLMAMRFLDLAPDAMRLPSVPGQENLGDRGENLSSVLHAICANEQRKQAILEWIKELTPLDVTDFVFVEDSTGRILVNLVEQDGQKTSAYSASDGTLRFLAMIAALLGPQAGRFYFFEELENGIHPTRLYLLLQLIEQQVRKDGVGKMQVVATTHSSQLLGFVSSTTLESTSLVYRLEGRSDARIRRILDIPDAARLVKEQNASTLQASGWFENAVNFTEPEEEGQSASEGKE